ncbi:MAG: hypothetical protein AAF488_00995 [Planctomycetota bacterium]
MIKRCTLLLLLLVASLGASPVSGQTFVRGDVESNGPGLGGIDIPDVILMLAHLFIVGETWEPMCRDAADANDDGAFDVSDPVYLLAFLFAGGPEPLPPYPDCGTDATSDGLGCESHYACP